MLRRTFRIYRKFHHNSENAQAIGEASTYVDASYKLYTKFFPGDEKAREEAKKSPTNIPMRFIYFIQEEYTAQEPMKDLY